MKLNRIIFLYLVLYSTFLGAQTNEIENSDIVESYNCPITQTKQKLNNRFFASTLPIQFRVNNNEFTYTTFQLGKRKNSIFLYLRILEDNICIKKDRNVDVYFKSGEIISLKNEYSLNCESFFGRQLTKKEIQKFLENDITLIKIYTYKKNYELYVNEVQNQEIKNNIICLSEYEIKESDEVKIKKKENDSVEIINE